MPEFKNAASALEWNEQLADAIWDRLAAFGFVDARGSVEYERRISGLRAWVYDAEGQPPEAES